jgi:uncharacterized membrane protein YgaE (UPF0421/DUF939 family)
MSAKPAEEQDEAPRKRTPEEKKKEHIGRIQRTLVACFLGIITGAISYLVVPPGHVQGFQSYTMLALMIMLAGVVVQRHIFVLMRMTSFRMGAKDWLYQGFMTFALWFITWTLLLTRPL